HSTHCHRVPCARFGASPAERYLLFTACSYLLARDRPFSRDHAGFDIEILREALVNKGAADRVRCSTAKSSDFTLKNRTVGPAVNLFIQCARQVVRPFEGK